MGDGYVYGIDGANGKIKRVCILSSFALLCLIFYIVSLVVLTRQSTISSGLFGQVAVNKDHVYVILDNEDGDDHGKIFVSDPKVKVKLSFDVKDEIKGVMTKIVATDDFVFVPSKDDTLYRLPPSLMGKIKEAPLNAIAKMAGLDESVHVITMGASKQFCFFFVEKGANTTKKQKKTTEPAADTTD